MNRLALEKSPYLLQHQHNPVDWHPWSEEAFAKARLENKPIFLSIGYSTCHWCHVMERESFENQTVARVLNEHFVSIKVDREERPDVDHIYMTFLQATGVQGGWPLNCFLTPALKPFYGGTYFPPEDYHGRPGFLTVLRKIHDLWLSQQDKLVASAEHIQERLASLTLTEAEPGLVLNQRVLREAGLRLKQGYDPVHGGFGGAPKFPQPALPAFLLRWGARFDDAEAESMVLHTCERMAAGGICDQLGGGFARYSVDERWLVPHFEKMLYDNAQLAQLYLDAFLVAGNQAFADSVRGILGYVLREMTHPEGGFYSAEDADSEGKEGKFYCWTRAELAGLLSPEEFNVAVKYFGVTATGNFIDHSDPNPLPGQNVLHVADAVVPPTDQPLLRRAKETMFQARAGRVRPLLDDKILTSWNGLMLGALARASIALNDPCYLAAAEKNLAFLKQRLWDESAEALGHCWREGHHKSIQLLEDYAFLLAGVLDLYEVTLDPAHLAWAICLAKTMIRQFYDEAKGGFWQRPPGGTDLILRLKEDYDGALPSGNSMAVCALLKLAVISGASPGRESASYPGFMEVAEKSLQMMANRLQQMPLAVPCLLQALDFWVGPVCRVIIAGPPQSDGTRQLLRTAHAVYRPNKVVMGQLGSVEPFAATLPMKDNRPTAYVCSGTTCQAPTCAPEELALLLSMNRPLTLPSPHPMGRGRTSA